MDTQAYLEKVYGGLVGKCAGVRLGAPVEPTIWTYERIRETYGEITGYVKEYSNFAADDDINGPLFFIRALLDEEGPITAEAVSRAWLNYAREGIGFFWWGGYGRSTEHTAYVNLRSRCPAPQSGSIAVNGTTIAEQIGGQIFIDSWGWVFPNDAESAAHYAGVAAGVSHDRNAIYGARFIAACISLAFSHGTVSSIVEKALQQIPADCEYARVVRAMRDYHAEHAADWRAARDYLGADFGYDRYPGVCHVIPNAGVCALALFYGGGDFARTIEIATMCGWDTDCNAGNVGAILGVLVGPEGIPHRYRRPINDFHVTSSIAGALNIIDLPTAARELATLSLRRAGTAVPEAWEPGVFSDDIVLDFSLPGATSGIRTSSEFRAPPAPADSRASKDSTASRGATFLLDRLVRGDTVRLYYKPYYRREDFDDERYSPTFTPTAYPGQTLRVIFDVARKSGQRIAVAPFARDAVDGDAVQGAFSFPEPGEPVSLEWTLPDVPFAIAEVGLLVMNPDKEKFLGEITITRLEVTGPRSFSVRFADERLEFGGLSRCSLSGGAWELTGDALHTITRDELLLFSGPYYTRDSDVACELVPEYGASHLLAFRARGAASAYFFGLHGAGRAALIRRDHGDSTLVDIPYAWEAGENYRLEVRVRTVDGSCAITASVNGRRVLETTDPAPLPYGMAGVAKLSGGRTRFRSLAATEV